MARPQLEISEEQVRALAQIHCTYEEMALVLGCSVKTLRRRFDSLINEAREQGKVSLRRWQWKTAQAGSPAMQIWLGKQHLEQKDKHIHTGADGAPIAHAHLHAHISAPDLDAKIDRLLGQLKGLELEASGPEAGAEDLRDQTRALPAAGGEE